MITGAVELTGPSRASTFSTKDPQTGECTASDLSGTGATLYFVGDPLDPADVFPLLERTIRN